MGNKIDEFIKAAAIITGIDLVLDLIKVLGKRVYICPVCNGEVLPDAIQCPYCKTHFLNSEEKR